MIEPDVLDQAAVVVMRDGQSVFESYRGLADRASGEPITTTTRFQIASISKGFTATAALLLVDRGSLSLHDPIARWLEPAPSSWQPITIHHLLTHTSGLGHWPWYPELDLFTPIEPERELAVFQSHALSFEPGSRWSYSSPGYVVLANLVERVARQPYRQFVAARILQPLGLGDIIAGNAGYRQGSARGYEGGEPARPFELDTVGMGTGDLWSTARDLAQWMSSLEHPTVVSAGLQQTMLTPQATIEDPGPISGTAYGYGFRMGDVAGQPLIFHTGDNPGFRSLAGFFPETRAAFAWLSNEGLNDVTRVANQLASLVLGRR